MKDQLPDRAALERQIRKEIEREATEIARPIFQGITRWIQTTAWWKLVLAYVATWPLSWAEAFVMDIVTGFLPGVGSFLDGLIHTVDEGLFLTLPIVISLELTRRSWWATGRVIRWTGQKIRERIRWIRRKLGLPEKRTGADGEIHDVINAEGD